ncbi:hypothetical protein [Nocardia crassostreae]|uniref:hypothetical protein n=1 Tax=Nocardia crassostreae TaxID=53428 RepID=UPI000AC975A1
MTIETFTPGRDPEPVWWEEFIRTNGFRATWTWPLLAAAGPRLGLAVVHEGNAPVAMAAARWTVGIANITAPGSTGQPGWWRDRPAAARRLLLALSTLDQRLEYPAEVVVILEGAAKAAVTSPRTRATHA